jgi:hypothetical protein
MGSGSDEENSFGSTTLPLKAMLANRNSAAAIAAAFMEWRPRLGRYQLEFAVCEALNLVCVLASAGVTHRLLRRKFFTYGPEVIMYWLSSSGSSSSGSSWDVDGDGQQRLRQYLQLPYQQQQQQLMHDPMCELFPTEVACHIQVPVL